MSRTISVRAIVAEESALLWLDASIEASRAIIDFRRTARLCHALACPTAEAFALDSARVFQRVKSNAIRNALDCLDLADSALASQRS